MFFPWSIGYVRVLHSRNGKRKENQIDADQVKNSLIFSSNWLRWYHYVFRSIIGGNERTKLVEARYLASCLSCVSGWPWRCGYGFRLVTKRCRWKRLQSHITWDPEFSLSNDTLKPLSKTETVVPVFRAIWRFWLISTLIYRRGRLPIFSWVTLQ